MPSEKFTPTLRDSQIIDSVQRQLLEEGEGLIQESGTLYQNVPTDPNLRPVPSHGLNASKSPMWPGPDTVTQPKPPATIK